MQADSFFSRQGFSNYGALFSRYWDVTRAAWAQRHQHQVTGSPALEQQFLPAALELVETPPSPAPRAIAWTIMGLCIAAVIWASVGKIDIVAVAQGKMIPSDKTKIIQPLETGTIKNILVKEGQAVKEGDLLIELDTTDANADQEKVQQQLDTAQLDKPRNHILLNALTNKTLTPNNEKEFDQIKNINPIEIERSKHLTQDQLNELKTKLAALDKETERLYAALASSQEVQAKLQQTLPLATQKANDYENLMKQNYVAKHEYLEKQQELIGIQRDLEAQKNQAHAAQSQIEQNQNQHSAVIAEFKANHQDELNKAENSIRQLQQDHIKAEQHAQSQRITAPVDGVVQQLATNTIGGVVTSAQQLMVIVPTEHPLEIEAILENKDIGFVKDGQIAEVKLETFPFTKYGTIDATVEHVSRDAEEIKDKGLVYTARIKPERSYMWIEDEKINLAPGMAVTVEVKTGKRRIIEYILSPVVNAVRSAGRER